ncbi:MAG: GGDEF domain-containing protein, partial [Armatimonadota bacterium]
MMTEQLDYIYFFYGLGFILLAAICFLSPFFDKKQSALPWMWLGFFGLIHGLSEWQDMLALSLGNTLSLKAAHICLMALSFVCLVEFGRLGTKAVTGRGPGRWITVVLFVIGCTGWLYGWLGVDVFFRYSFGFVGGAWSAAALILAARHPENQDQRRSLIALGLLLATYALTGGLLVPQAPFLPAFLLTRD